MDFYEKASKLIDHLPLAYPPSIDLLISMIKTNLYYARLHDIKIDKLICQIQTNFELNFNRRFEWQNELDSNERRFQLIDLLLDYIPTSGSNVEHLLDRIQNELDILANENYNVDSVLIKIQLKAKEEKIVPDTVNFRTIFIA
jgi:hypothetical protein